MIIRFSVKLDSIVADHLARISFMMSVFVLSFFRYLIYEITQQKQTTPRITRYTICHIHSIRFVRNG